MRAVRSHLRVDALTPTLPDLLREGLDVLFVGINPSLFSVAVGHYFARPTNRFWPCFSRSRLSRKVRQALDLEKLEPAHDHVLLDHGFGFTDLVKRATAKAAELSAQEMAAGVTDLLAKIGRFTPRIACFHGVTAYRPFHDATIANNSVKATLPLGLQSPQLGRTRLFVVPNPSPANAHFTPEDQTRWYDQLAMCLAEAAIDG